MKDQAAGVLFGVGGRVTTYQIRDSWVDAASV